MKRVMLLASTVERTKWGNVVFSGVGSTDRCVVPEGCVESIDDVLDDEKPKSSLWVAIDDLAVRVRVLESERQAAINRDDKARSEVDKLRGRVVAMETLQDIHARYHNKELQRTSKLVREVDTLAERNGEPDPKLAILRMLVFDMAVTFSRYPVGNSTDQKRHLERVLEQAVKNYDTYLAGKAKP